MQSDSILHTVSFRLNPGVDPVKFFEAAATLAAIPGVDQFKILEQTGNHSEFTHALSMVFTDAQAHQAYNVHPDHAEFLTKTWNHDVNDFLELDYRLA